MASANVLGVRISSQSVPVVGVAKVRPEGVDPNETEPITLRKSIFDPLMTSPPLGESQLWGKQIPQPYVDAPGKPWIAVPVPDTVH